MNVTMNEGNDRVSELVSGFYFLGGIVFSEQKS